MLFYFSGFLFGSRINSEELVQRTEPDEGSEGKDNGNDPQDDGQGSGNFILIIQCGYCKYNQDSYDSVEISHIFYHFLSISTNAI